MKCFQNYSKEESQTLSLFEISHKNLTEAVNKLTKIDVFRNEEGKNYGPTIFDEIFTLKRTKLV